MNQRGTVISLLRKLRKPRTQVAFGLSASEFEAAFQREKSLASRSLRAFAMVVFLPCGGGEVGQAGLARILEKRLRTSDLAGRLDDDLMAVLLPETDEVGANAFVTAVMLHLAQAELKFDFKIYVYPADGGDDDDLDGSETDTDASDTVGRSSVTSDTERDLRRVDFAAPLQAPLRNEASQHGLRSLNLRDAARQPRAAAIVDGEPFELGDVRTSIGVSRAHDLRTLFCEPPSVRRRGLDIVVSATALVLLAPVLALVALAVKLSSPGPVLFVQRRAGHRGVPFDFYKFRSMYIDAEQRKAALAGANEQTGPIFKIKNDPRITKIGRILRRSSLDELPQLFNVLRGDMTLVGPRPPTLSEVERYEPWQRARLSVIGGLTCTWQVSGRSEIGFEDWMRMDLRYAQRHNVFTDLGLLAKTAGAVVSRRGAY